MSEPSPALIVLSHLGDAEAIQLPADLRDAVEVVRVSTRQPPGDEVRGDVLLTLGHGVDTLEEVLDRGVRWLHVTGTGLDKFPIELVPPDVVFTNSQGASAVPIAEWTLAVMLAFEKRLPESFATEPWDRAARFTAPPLGTLHGRTLAIFGLGGIGTAIATRALPFGMQVRALRRHDRPADDERIEMAASLAELVDGADHVVIAAPLTDETRGSFDDELFASMKPGVHVVNIARGAIIDEDALRRALDDGVVACASLDAVEPEPLPEGHWMYSHPKVRLSPHISWSAPGAIDTMFVRFAENLRAYLAGEPLQGIVDREAGY